MINLSSVIAAELNVTPNRVEAVLELLKEGGTVPFIARYRKEKTGALDEVQIRTIQERSEYLNELGERKTAVLKSIEEQGKLTPELKAAVEKSLTKNELEDLYLPFKPKRRTRATIAKERGLEPLAELLWAQGDAKDLAEMAAPFVDPAKEVINADQAWAGARDIVAERISEDAAARKIARDLTMSEGEVVTGVIEEKKEEKSKFEGYYDHREALARIPSHRYLAIRRGEKEGFLRVTVETPAEKIVSRIETATIKNPASALAAEMKKAIGDACARLIAPSIENEIRDELKTTSDEGAIDVFAINLRNLLLASPLGGKTVIGLDPGFRTGVKVAVIDKTGKVVEHAAIYPFFASEEKRGEKKGERKGAKSAPIEKGAKPAEKSASAPAEGEATAALEAEAAEAKSDAPADSAPAPREASEKDLSKGAEKLQQAKVILAAMLAKHDAQAIAIGNGTAGRETEAFVEAFLKEWAEPAGKKVLKVMVSEQGASVYSASDIAREEFPDLDITVRGAISIGRRLQDPLAELVKLDPKSIGVGQYQHDVNQARLKRKLSEIVESCVNAVGVDANTASRPLLAYVAGIGPSLAKRIVEHREKNGQFKSRDDLKKVTLFGDKAFEQAAGFLRVRDSVNPLDNSAVHPETYVIVEKMAADLGVTTKELVGNAELAAKVDPTRYTDEKVGAETLKDILEELKKPGRDPRAEFSGPNFRADITDIRDLEVGMMLDGLVTNVTNFGAFVDIGVHQDGLVHVSEISHTFVKDPTTTLKVGDRVKVKVLAVEGGRKRISLSIKQTQAAPPRSERGPRRGGQPRTPGAGEGARPPRGDRRPRRDGAQAGAPNGAPQGPRRGGQGRPMGPGARPMGPGGRPGEGRPGEGRPQRAGGPSARPGGPGGRSARPPEAPKKIGTHGKKVERKVDGVMGPDRTPREHVPQQKKPDNSLGALFGDLLKEIKK